MTKKRRRKKKESTTEELPQSNELLTQEALEAGFEEGTISAKNLRKSREFKEEFIRKYGDYVSSILQYDRKIKHTDLSRITRGGGYANSQNRNREEFSDNGGLSIFSKTGFITRNRKDYLSTFPMNIGKIIIGLYAPERCKVYDPFAGHNSRMELCFNMGNSYTGVDICKSFMEANREVRDFLIKKSKRELLPIERSINLIEGSSVSRPEIPDNSHDFTITSPPYWDIENYGPEPEQLGVGKTYEEFLRGMQLVANENFRILKPGAFAAYFINDFRKNKKFYPYHIHTYELLEKAGFNPFNIYVVDLMTTPNKSFLQWVVKTRILPKVHEYIVMVQKPEEE